MFAVGSRPTISSWWQYQPSWCSSPLSAAAFLLWRQWRLSSKSPFAALCIGWSEIWGIWIFGYLTGSRFLKNEGWVYWLAYKTTNKSSSELALELSCRREIDFEKENSFPKDFKKTMNSNKTTSKSREGKEHLLSDGMCVMRGNLFEKRSS